VFVLLNKLGLLPNIFCNKQINKRKHGHVEQITSTRAHSQWSSKGSCKTRTVSIEFAIQL